MSLRLLLSFCNNQKKMNLAAGEGILGLVRVSDQGELSYQPLPLKLGAGQKVNGATGLMATESGYLAVLQASTPLLVNLNREFEIIKITELNGMKGVHSICRYQDQLLLVSTKQDRIYQMSADGEVSVFYDLKTNADTEHLNSICVHQDQVLFSAFGKNNKDFWTQATNGYVKNIHTNEVEMDDLKQPHSLLSLQDTYCLCDSSRQRVVDQFKSPLAQTETGYVRGLCCVGDRLFYGVSKGRSVSSSTGKYIGNISNEGILAGQARIVCVAGQAEVNSLNLSAVTDEIYDIIPCPE